MVPRILVAAVILTFGAFPALGQSPEQLLQDRFRGKLLLIRNFYFDNQLRYDPSGKIKGHPEQDAWTTAEFKIQKVRLRHDGFELEGQRIAIGWDNKKQSVAFFKIKPLSIRVEDLPSAALTPDKLDQLAKQIFVVLRDEPETVPKYWRELVSGNVVAQTDAQGHETFRLKDRPDSSPVPNDATVIATHSEQGDPIYRVGGKVSAPRLLSHHDPDYSPLARQIGYNGTALLSVTVNESGLPDDIQVLRPAGFGLDDAAVEAVTTWKFEPAELEGKPVKVAVQIEVDYHISR